MTSLVTGGTGFIGAHVVRALLAEGAEVRCLVRPGRPAENLEGLRVERALGDLADAASLARAARGVERVFHCAADYRLGAVDRAALFDTNVAGTERVMRAAAEAGVRRVVHTSSVGALGLAPGGLADEDTPVERARLAGAYKRSKYDAERVALRWAARGLAVVVVNPAAPVGELDVRPTPTGQVIVDHLRGRLRAYVDTGLDVVDVRDVARGHVLAAERGRAGERYILGHRNLTLLELLERLAAITGVPAPRVRLPRWVPMLAAGCEELAARAVGRDPRLSLESVRMARHRMFFSSAKAARELGFAPGPVEPALERAVRWFVARGLAPAPPGLRPASRNTPAA
jgi:dihydroflavonol-4-reductase